MNVCTVGFCGRSVTPWRISSAFHPASSGTRLWRPAAKMVQTSSGRKYPSRAGMKPGCVLDAAASRSAAGLARSAASESAPSELANVTPRSSATASGASGSVPLPAVKNAPLSPIARWNSPRASGDAMSALTENEPADSPKIVTLPGSPPNAAMLSCTQRSAATWSRMP